MILGVNGIRLTTPRSGVGRYLENVLRCWAEQSHPFTEINVYTPSPLRDPLPGKARNVVVPPMGPLAIWEQWQLPARHGAKDVLFCPSYVAPVTARCPIALVHHGSYESFPSEFTWWTRFKSYHSFRLSARRADVLITVSEHSRRDMARHYAIPADRIHVIPEGVDTALFRPLADPGRCADFRRRVLGEDVPFILFVGKPVRRRNLPELLRAFKRLKSERNLPHRFLLIGSDLPGLPVKAMVEELELQDDVKMLGYASHEEIVVAYNACYCLVYPSSYEGFGMPVLEAMACGTPAIALRNTAFLEFADGVALLAERGGEKDLFAAMDRVLSDGALRTSMREEGPKRAAPYDWKLIAERTMKLIVQLAEARK